MAVSDIITPYSCVAKILKVPVFRLALGNDLVSRIVIYAYNFFSRLFACGTPTFRSFDPEIAQRSVDRFVALGANVRFVVPRDGKGSVQMMTFRSEDLEEKIRALGGSWERRNIGKKEVLAIVPPRNRSAEWYELAEKLSHFHWPEHKGMLITSDCADLIPENAPTQCFLFAHSTTSSFARDWKKAGFLLGAKQDICFFDNGNTWKNQGRTVSEESFYLEIEAVYDQIKDNYRPEHFWVGGSCGGTPVAAYLKRQHHQEGINFFAEQSFPDLDDFVKPISPFFAPRVKGSLKDDTLPPDLENPPPSCQFGAAKLWEHLEPYEGARGGKFILVQVREDEHIGPDAYARYLALAKKINRNVTHIIYSSEKKSKHADEFVFYKNPRRQFTQAMFQ